MKGIHDIPSREAIVRTYAVRLRSNIHRSADRAIRHGELTRLLGHKPRLPRPDNEIMAAWVIRGAKRAGAWQWVSFTIRDGCPRLGRAS